jgi:peroxiredoxin Q/BCP
MLVVGKKAPKFALPNQKGEIVSLKDYTGKKVALYFYPKDDTPGCTAQACNLRDNISLLKKNDIEIVGVSVDSVKKHLKFEEKFELPFALLSDEEKVMVNDYEVWGEKKFMGKAYMGTSRVTFLLDEKSKIIAIIDKVDTKNHTAQILEAFGI